VPPLDFEIKVFPAGSTTDSNGNSAARGTVALRLTNPLPFDLTNCTLIIGGTRTADEYQQALLQRQMSGWNQRAMYGVQQAQQAAPAGSGLVDVYCRQPLRDLTAGATIEESYECLFDVAQNDWNQLLHLQTAAISPPKIAHLGASTAWIIGRIRKSSIMQIDRQHSDFEEEDEPVHLFLQEIRPGDLIDADGFLRQSPPAADNSAQPQVR
jgi:hypothetical protein